MRRRAGAMDAMIGRWIFARLACVAAALAAVIGVVLLVHGFPEPKRQLPAWSPGSAPREGAVPSDHGTAVNDAVGDGVPGGEIADVSSFVHVPENPPEDPALSIIRKLDATPRDDLEELWPLFFALGDSGSRRAVDWFLEALGRPSPSWDPEEQDRFRRLIAMYLGILGDPRAIPTLESLAALEGTTYRYQYESGKIVEVRWGFPEIARGALQEIEYQSRLKAAATEEEKIELHLDQLLRPDGIGIRICGPLDVLRKIGEKAVPIILARIARSSPKDREQLFSILGAEMGSVVRGHPEFRTMVERAAVEEVARASEPDAAIAALRVLECLSEDEEVLRSIRIFGDAMAPSVAGVVRDIHGQIEDPHLRKLASVQRSAVFAADRIELRIRIRGKSETERIPDYWWALGRDPIRAEARRELIDLGEPASAYILERIRAHDLDSPRLLGTVGILGAIYRQRIGDENALQALLHLARNASPSVAECAVGELGFTWSPEASALICDVRTSLEAFESRRELSIPERNLLFRARNAERNITEGIAERQRPRDQRDQAAA